MAFQTITGGAWIGVDDHEVIGVIGNGGFSTGLIDATGEKFAFCGRVNGPYFSGTKDIARVQFRFGTVTKAGGSALTVSLQDLATAAGPPYQPDETQDQTVAIANADASFVSNTWYRTGTFSADRTVSWNDPLAVVIEYDGGGRLGADAVNINYLDVNTAIGLSGVSLKTGGTWAVLARSSPNVVLEVDDGTFLNLGDGYPVKTHTALSYDSGSAADEVALPFSFPYGFKIDRVRLCLLLEASTSDFDIVIYEGTTAKATTSVDANQYVVASAGRVVEVPMAEFDGVADTQYYLSIKPTTANNVSIYYWDVDDANHLSVYPGGTGWNYTTRVDAGSWAAATTTRRMLASVRLSAVDIGSGGSVVMPPILSGGGLLAIFDL